jgi:hypothetical protein
MLLMLASLSLFCLLFVPKCLRGQAADDPVGKRVVPKIAKLEVSCPAAPSKLTEIGPTSPFDILLPPAPANAKPAEKLARSTPFPRFYRVLERVGSRLWVKSDDETVAGWVQADCVIPVEGAIEFFANPKDAFSFAMRVCCDSRKTSSTRPQATATRA